MRLTPKQRDYSRQLRSAMTDAERKLWRALRSRQLDGTRFRRQAPLGAFIVDFVCFEKRLIVEVDGGQHGDQLPYDADRDRWLGEEGFRVLRFWNNDVLKNLDGVVQTIIEALVHPHPVLSPSKGEGTL